MKRNVETTYGIFFKAGSQEQRSDDHPDVYYDPTQAILAAQQFSRVATGVDDYYVKNLQTGRVVSLPPEDFLPEDVPFFLLVCDNYNLQEKEAKQFTDEERIRRIRLNIEAGLYVPATEVNLLLTQLEAAQAANQVLRDANVVLEEKRR